MRLALGWGEEVLFAEIDKQAVNGCTSAIALFKKTLQRVEPLL